MHTVMLGLGEWRWADSCSLLSSQTNLKVSLGFNERCLKNQKEEQLEEIPDIKLWD